jgi:hypothetical protein
MADGNVLSLNLSKKDIVLDLKKTFELNLRKVGLPENLVMRTKLGMDRSTSMEGLFRNGWVQNVFDLFLAAAMRFDDDGELEAGFFNTGHKEYPNATLDDAGVYIQRHGIKADGGTRFAPTIASMIPSGGVRGIFSKILGAVTTPPAPIYMAMGTDGQNDDRKAFEKELERVSGTRSFIQIFGIGGSVDTDYLTRVARLYDNVAFFNIPNPNDLTPNSMYEAICNDKFVAWLTANGLANPHVQGLQ